MQVTRRKLNHYSRYMFVYHPVQTCSPKELLLVLLELVEDIHPDAIADTITVLVPHLQTGNHALEMTV